MFKDGAISLTSGPAVRLLTVFFVLVIFGCATGPPPKRVVLKSEMTFSVDYGRIWAAFLDTLDRRTEREK